MIEEKYPLVFKYFMSEAPVSCTESWCIVKDFYESGAHKKFIESYLNAAEECLRQKSGVDIVKPLENLAYLLVWMG